MRVLNLKATATNLAMNRLSSRAWYSHSPPRYCVIEDSNDFRRDKRAGSFLLEHYRAQKDLLSGDYFCTQRAQGNPCLLSTKPTPRNLTPFGRIRKMLCKKHMVFPPSVDIILLISGLTSFSIRGAQNWRFSCRPRASEGSCSCADLQHSWTIFRLRSSISKGACICVARHSSTWIIHLVNLY